MTTIVTLTLNPAIDQTTEVARILPETKLRCSNLHRQPGGGGINVAKAIHILGGKAMALWTSGGQTGPLLESLLDELQIPHHPIPIKDPTRMNLHVFDGASKAQYRFDLPGAAMTPEEAEHCLETVQSLDPAPDYFVISGGLAPELPPDFYTRVLRILPASCRTILDTHGAALKSALNTDAFLIKPNLSEFREVTGRPLADEAEIEAAAHDIIKNGSARHIVISLGAAGAVWVDAEQAEWLRAPTAPMRSKVGAGDSMVAGITLRLAAGDSVREAVRYGIAAGTAAVMTPGTGLCRCSDVENLYKQMNASADS